MKDNRTAGVITIVLCTAAAAFLLNFLWKGLTTGMVPGKLGAIHMAGSVSYAVGIGAGFLGLAMLGTLAWMGVRWFHGEG